MSTIRRAYMEISNGIRGLRLHRDQSPSNISVDTTTTTATTTTATTTTSTTSSTTATTTVTTSSSTTTLASTSTTITTTTTSTTTSPAAAASASAASSTAPGAVSPKSTLAPGRDGTSLTSQMQASASATAAAIKKTIQRGAEGSSAALATRFVRSPKAGIARRIRRLNQSINGHQQRPCADTMSELMMDEEFLAKFFLYFSPSERGLLCQVCRKWRKMLYCPKYWLDAMPVVSYRHRLPSRDSSTLRHVYDSIQQRGFDSICLFGATDEDVSEFVNNFQTCKSHLRSLSIRCSNISDQGLEVLFRKMPCIYRLELSGCNEITESGLWACLNAKIVSLCIMDCINVADDTLGAISQLLPSLYELNLQAYHVTDAALALFSPKQSYTLSVLRLTSCWEVTNNGLVNIVNALPNLTVLGLSGCSKVSDDGVELVAEHLRRLRVLDLSWCPRISDASLEYIACDLGQLQELVLDRCQLVTDMGIGYLSTMASLHKLYLRYCQQVHDLGLHHLYSMRKLTHLSLAVHTTEMVTVLCVLSAFHSARKLLLSGDVEMNPGPNHHEQDNQVKKNTEAATSAQCEVKPSVQSDVTREILQAIKQQTDQQTALIRGDLGDIKSELDKVKQQCVNINTRCDKIEQEYHHLAAAVSDVASDIQYLHSEVAEGREVTTRLTTTVDTMEQKISKIESEIDKLEEYSRRENLRFFGIPPLGQNENNDTCVSAVVDTLNSVERGVKKWTPDDIVRAHRIGQTREGNPRPMIVRFARWRDKMTIITDRDLRNKLTEKGVKVANDLTRAQSSVVAEARREGKKAYFRKGKLVIAPLPPDPRTYAEAASVGVADCSPVAHSTAAGRPPGVMTVVSPSVKAKVNSREAQKGHPVTSHNTAAAHVQRPLALRQADKAGYTVILRTSPASPQLVTGCEQARVESMMNYVPSCDSDVSGCSQISPNALCGLTRLPNLLELELTNCPSATPSVVHYLRENMYGCLVIH
ncbi:uncharacterized protein LOC143282607 [Babylonia areolata]|uniref:uncharacterized protein LOC143282607 n=1 Tax=Babylonia areolata TaxID=304850 RepID=UPI003FD5BBFA